MARLIRYFLIVCLFAVTCRAFTQDLSACIVAQKAKKDGNLERAVSLYTTCIDEGELADVYRSIALNNRGNLYLDQKQYNRAIADFDKAIELNPRFAKPWNNRGMANQFKGLYQAAVEDYRAALEIDQELLNTANNLAWLRATCPVSSIRNGKEALELALRVNGATNFRDPENLATLAAAYAEIGKYSLAISYQRRAMELAEDDRRQQHKEQLSWYQQGRAYRDLSNL